MSKQNESPFTLPQEIIIKCIFCNQNSLLGHLTSNTHYLSPPLRNLCLQELWEINTPSWKERLQLFVTTTKMSHYPCLFFSQNLHITVHFSLQVLEIAKREVLCNFLYVKGATLWFQPKLEAIGYLCAKAVSCVMRYWTSALVKVSFYINRELYISV